MKYDLKYSKAMKKFLKQHKDLAPKIVYALEEIAKNPYSNHLDIKRLQNYENHYRLRIAKYRILYEIIEKEILIYAYDADSRGDIYKKN